MNDRQLNNDANNNNGSFICGVVEGFYGKPWSWDQRKELFSRLKDFKLNSFMYAPKDDTKHRAKWRQLYNENEAAELKSLIHEAKRNGIDFYYSLAPGLDMVYSDREELNRLFQKFDQLVSFGCESFALLFDDIEPSINERDREVFKNYASAQVYVTNAIHEHLNEPKFLFCPTEYCESRASPNVTNSNYLNTIGLGLNKDIDIMWSGSRVISRFITVESIEILTKTIRRPPVIWENLHANDYDKKRVFLGPYSGRSTKIISKLRGVLTNPNCEYEANFIPIHTLAQWSRCTEDVNPLNQSNPTSIYRTQDDNLATHKPWSSTYDPDKALVLAIRDWLPKILENRSPASDSNLDVKLTQDYRDDEAASTQLNHDALSNKEGHIADEAINVDMVHEENSASTSSPLGGSNKSDMDTTGSPIRLNNVDNNSCDSCKMLEDVTESEAPQALSETLDKKSDSSSLNCAMYSSSSDECNTVHPTALDSCSSSESVVNIENLSLLVDLYYLPFEHGYKGITLLDNIRWLRDHSEILIAKNLQDKKDHQDQNDNYSKLDNIESNRETKMNEEDNNSEQQLDHQQIESRMISFWLERAEKLNEFCICIGRLVNTLIYDCPNKLLIIELYPYLIEMRDVMALILDYIKFLRYRTSSSDSFYYSADNPHNRQSKEQQVDVQASDDEPWSHRGGLIGDVQRLLS